MGEVGSSFAERPFRFARPRQGRPATGGTNRRGRDGRGRRRDGVIFVHALVAARTGPCPVPLIHTPPRPLRHLRILRVTASRLDWPSRPVTMAHSSLFSFVHASLVGAPRALCTMQAAYASACRHVSERIICLRARFLGGMHSPPTARLSCSPESAVLLAVGLPNSSPAGYMLVRPSWAQADFLAPCQIYTPPRLALLRHPSRLHMRSFVPSPCLRHTPPPRVMSVHPSWAQVGRFAPCRMHTPPRLAYRWCTPRDASRRGASFLP